MKLCPFHGKQLQLINCQLLGLGHEDVKALLSGQHLAEIRHMLKCPPAYNLSSPIYGGR